MASPRERTHRSEVLRSGNVDRRLLPSSSPSWLTSRPARRHHFHGVPPWPHQHHHDYINVGAGWGWWPRWYPYSDPGWYQYWWQLYDYYGGDANPEYAEYARDAALRQRAPELGLNVNGYSGGAQVSGYYGGAQVSGFYGSPQVGRHTQPTAPAEHHEGHYQHPHYYYGDYVTVNGAWWPRWFPYWDPAWHKYWWQLYYHYGGDAHRNYAEYARDMVLRTQGMATAR